MSENLNFEIRVKHAQCHVYGSWNVTFRKNLNTVYWPSSWTIKKSAMPERLERLNINRYITIQAKYNNLEISKKNIAKLFSEQAAVN